MVEHGGVYHGCCKIDDALQLIKSQEELRRNNTVCPTEEDAEVNWTDEVLQLRRQSVVGSNVKSLGRRRKWKL